jgi:sugar phosphate isomerase/epimerase
MTKSIGVCTWTFGDLALPDIAQRLSQLGFDGVELAGDLSAYTAVEAKTILDDHGLRIFSLTPDNVDLAHPGGSLLDHRVDHFFIDKHNSGGGLLSVLARFRCRVEPATRPASCLLP